MGNTLQIAKFVTYSQFAVGLDGADRVELLEAEFADARGLSRYRTIRPVSGSSALRDFFQVLK